MRIPIAMQRLSKHVQTNTQQQKQCSLWVLAVTAARQQPVRRWTAWVAITWEPQETRMQQ
jgi:hypothetical protein